MLRSAPLTVGYLLVLSATNVLLSSSSAQTDDRLSAFSTNLHQLVRVPLRVLVASAFWTSGWGQLAL